MYNKSAKIDTLITNYDDVGVGEIPLLFIHGFPFDKSSWQKQLDFFKHSNRVITYDIRGFGKSTADDKEVSIPLFADDVIKLMDFLSIPKAIIIGLSMGGYILLNLLNRYPDRIAALVLCDTQCIADTVEAKEKRYKTIEKIKSEGLADFAETFVKNVFCEESLTNKKQLVETVKATILRTPPQVITKTLSALAERQETCSILYKISLPTLIICGKQDKAVPITQSEFLHQNISNSLFSPIENAGHLPSLEQPETFNEHLRKFLDASMK